MIYQVKYPERIEIIYSELIEKKIPRCYKSCYCMEIKDSSQISMKLEINKSEKIVLRNNTYV